ncbi:miraculin-like [Prosopis cineraria]|uniref:miraculin-like n=1 Tax=Prosopis cineraria TaxID=364024 RepID=UPI00240F220B|nr:miraculin-like [Prosopis cineraria]
MKPTILAFAFLMAVSTQTLLLASAGPSPEQVVDTDGKKVRAGVNYYIRPVPETPCDGQGPCVNGEGLVLIARSVNVTCPLNVAVVVGFRGLPLTFTPVNPKKGVVRVSTDQNIKFNLTTACKEGTVWKLDDLDTATGRRFITTGGVVGNPGPETIGNWFKIEKYEDDYYKLMYCPSVCKFCKVLCKDVGVFVDQNGNRRLALSDKPMKVRFQLASA